MITQLNIHPYPKKIWLIYDEPDSSVIHKLATEADDYRAIYTLDQNDTACTIRTKKGNVVMRFTTKPSDPGIIVHESFHAVYNILDFVGMKLSEESEEAFAYLLDSIVT